MVLGKTRSTTDVIITLDSLISDTIRKEEYTALLSLDISSAYDTCCRDGILRKLKQWKIDGRILQFIKNFISNRKLRIAVRNYYNGQTNPKEIKNGVVQGAVLSVTLFLIANMVKRIKETCNTILRYADDWLIVASTNAPIRVETGIEEAASSDTRWASDNSFKISPEKTKIMLIHRRRPRIEGNTKFKLRTEKVEMV
jgi:hypothetical protein